MAHVTVGANTSISAPAGWTTVVDDNYGNFVRQSVWYRVATASEPADYTWSFAKSRPASGGISAFYGIKTATAPGPLDVADTSTATSNSGTVTASSIATTTADALVLAFFAARNDTTFTTASGMTELYESGASGGVAVATDSMIQAAPGATGTKQSSLGASSRNSGTQVAWDVDDIDPTGSVTDPGPYLAGAVVLDGDAADADSAVTSAVFQRSPAGAGTWTPVGTDTSSPYSVSFDSTAVADGVYDLRVVVTDAAGNVLNSAIVQNRRIDNTPPSSTTTFPAPAGVYNAAGWNAGCPAVGFCGTYSDSGSGIGQVEISIRQGAGNYWSGVSFSSAAEVWNATSLSAGDWSYPFAAGSFPATGSYTIRMRATDNAGNVQTPSSRTFTVDKTAPETAIDSNPADPSASTGADFTFSASEPGSTFECRLDGGAWGGCASPKSYAGLSQASHVFEVRATDPGGTTDATPATFTWLVDTTAPSSTLSFPAAAGSYTAVEWDAGCPAPGLCGTADDGSGSGVDAVQVSVERVSTGLFWAGASFSSNGEVLLSASTAAGDWALAFPASNFPADGDYTIRVHATDAAGNAETPSSRTFAVDATAPTASLTAPVDGAAVRSASVAVSSDSADAGSGVASAEFQQRPSGSGAWTTIGTDTSAPYSVSWDTTPLADGDYDLRVLTTDHAGNTTTSATRTVTVDNSPPSAPALTLDESSPYAHVSGSEIFVNGAETGTYDVGASSSDPGSGIDKVRFPGPTDDSTSPYSATYAFGDLSGSQTVIAFNGAGLTASSQFTVTPDTAGPVGGSVDYPDGYDADGDVAIALDAGSDPLSGVDAGSAVLERRTAPLSNGSCDPFAGPWSAVASPDAVSSGQCAQYRYRVTDHVGNEAVYASANVVEVDLASPAAPVVSLDESSPYAHVSGSEIFVNTAETGSYDVLAAASDPASGIEKVAFPGGVEDTTAPYAATYDLDDLSGVRTVTAHDRAGNTASSDFWVTEDVSAPSTTDDSSTIGTAWRSGPATVTLTPTDARSGVASTYYTTDGSVPTTASGEGTSIDLTVDGVYLIRYFSVDNVGNVEPVRTAFALIRIDTTNPVTPAVSLSESSPYAHVAGSEIFVNPGETGMFDVDATSSDSGSGVDRIAFPGGIDDTTAPYSASYGLADLSGVETVTAHDGAGNAASATFTVTPDAAAPTGGSVDYPDGYDADGIVTITVADGTDALSGIDPSSGVIERRTSALVAGVCDPFAGSWSAVASPDTLPDSTCARYRYRISDRVGNEAIHTLPTSTVKVDLSAPQTTIDVAPSDPSADGSPTFEFSADEAGSTFECRLDGGAWSACASPATVGPLADGSHTFQARATDSSGQTDGTPASHTWTIDTVAPETTLDGVPADPSEDDAPSFEFSSNEAGAGFECALDGGAWAPCTSPETVGLLLDGSHTFEVRAVDAAGNVDATPAVNTWTVDTVAPESSFTLTPSDPTNDTDPSFAFTSTEGGSTFQCRLDGGAWSACTSPATVGPLADGSHTFEVRATDSASNQELTPEAYTWVTDAGAPSVTITDPSSFVSAADADPYAVRATSGDGDVTGVEFFRCSDASAACAAGTWISLGTDAAAPYEASWPVDADGNRALRAVATDVAANTGSDVVDVTIDRTVPATAIDSAPSDPSDSAGAGFEFSASEGGVSFECRLDAGSWGACTSPKAYAGLTEGSHTFLVRATDPAGNTDPTPAIFAWTVDTTAPQTTIDSAPSDPSGSPAPSFEFSSSESGSTFACRLDGDDWDACTSPKSYAGLADGSHTFDVRATDPAGNTDPSPATSTWTIDSTPPAGGLADPGQYLRGTVALSASPSDAGAGIQGLDFQVSPADADSWTSIDVDTTDPYGVAWDTTSLTDGLYDLRIVVTDNASNSTATAPVEDRLVDNTAPGATMDDPGAHLRATVSLTASAADAGSGLASVAFERSLAGTGSWTAVSASWVTTGVADGLYDLRVTVTDNAGNSSISAPVVNRAVDNTKPGLTDSNPADGSTVAGAGSLALVASEDVDGVAGATIDGAAAPAPGLTGDTVTFTQAFSAGPHVLAGELEDLAGNRQPIRVHFTVWTGVTADYPYVEKNVFPAAATSLRSTSDTTTVTVPDGAWSGAPAGDWLVVRIDPMPASGASNGFAPAGETLDVSAYWALAGTPVTSFSLPLQIEFDNTQAHVVPATFESGAWRPLAEVPGAGLPASWSDGFAFDGTDVRILSRHLTLFTLLEDVQAPSKPGGFKGVPRKGKFTLSWRAASDNSGRISAYRVYVNGNLLKTVDGSVRSTGMGKYKLTDRRAFRVAAVDTAGNVGTKTTKLKIVPKVKKLRLSAAKSALRKRGFKVGRVRYASSASVPKGRVIKGSTAGLRIAGSKIGLTVSKGAVSYRVAVLGTSAPPPSSTPRPTSPSAPSPAPAPAPAPPTMTGTTPAPETEPPRAPVTPTATTEAEKPLPEPGRVLPLVGQRVTHVSNLRRELGFGLLAAAFSMMVLAALLARRQAARGQSPGDPALWDQRIIESIRRFIRLG